MILLFTWFFTNLLDPIWHIFYLINLNMFYVCYKYFEAMVSQFYTFYRDIRVRCIFFGTF